MKLAFTVDKEDGEVLAVYFELSEGEIARTIEIAEGECYVDVDANGSPLGVEMLAPGHVELMVKKVAKKYSLPEMTSAVQHVKQMLKAC